MNRIFKALFSLLVIERISGGKFVVFGGQTSTTPPSIGPIAGGVSGALVVIIIGIVLAVFTVKRRRTGKPSEQQNDDEHARDKHVYENFRVSEADNSAYEILDRTQGASEHLYHTASVSAPKSMVSPGNTDYMNLQI
ncbi:uncharacterized protein LOC123527760 isoform X2 [Mercenaria mercenaria]|uniref:uncharacterized protein LOC123527760 isoform X2 n=1 Tax=Mercenaria mercenaria TaxID=6596 RepID=UPI00234FA7E3|nr:uncharacterized protein LOC123527760 isoform X2 [Mercenaria mercenaria]